MRVADWPKVAQRPEILGSCPVEATHALPPSTVGEFVQDLHGDDKTLTCISSHRRPVI